MGEVGSLGKTATLDSLAPTSAASAYFLVVQADSLSRFPLPRAGIVTIGRAPEVDLVIDHASVSRKHARVFMDGTEIRISDLDSHNGSRVNGTPLEATRVLMAGDVVSIGEVILVVHAELPHPLPQLILDEPSWRRRLAEEVTRALQFGRPLGVLAIASSTTPDGALRLIDVLGRDDDHIYALLPEANAATSARLATTVLRAMPEARVGVACCPDDASDPDSLVLAARAAVKVARDGSMATPADAVERRELGDRSVVICHPAMVRVYDLLKRLAASDLSVLINGETGVGKENAAFAVHHYSARSKGPFIVANCAGLNEGVAESQLFGHIKGAFTGAVTTQAGLFESADGGTLFLDEIGELAPVVQAKLLRALENKRITRLGETREREVDLRIVTATNRVLDEEIKAGRFRSDLHFRLGAAHVHLPPLRDRRCEIPVLFREFVGVEARRMKREPPVPTSEVMQRLLTHDWPGNVREVKSVAELAVTTSEDDRIELGDLPSSLVPVAHVTIQTPAPPDPSRPMRRLADEMFELERQRMTEALERTGGVKVRAAELIGMPIRTFKMKAKQYGL